MEELKDEDRKGNVFRVAKQLVRKNRDVVGAGCVRDNSGKIVVEEDKLLEVWKEHYDRISNEEFSWDRAGLTDVRPVCGPDEKISEEEVEAAIGKMKLGKAAGPSGVVADMLKAAGEDGTRVLVIIPLSALLATDGFIKGVVVFQVDWGMLLISAAEGVWMVTLLR